MEVPGAGAAARSESPTLIAADPGNDRAAPSNRGAQAHGMRRPWFRMRDRLFCAKSALPRAFCC